MIVNNLLAIDAGHAGAGNAWAYGVDGRLAHVGFAQGSVDAARGVYRFSDTVSQIVVELPSYQGDRSDLARVQDLLALMRAGTALAYYLAGAWGCPVREVTPTEWKGTRRKPQHHHAMWSVLDDDERAVLGGAATLATIEAACERGAAERWKRGGGAAYYPSKWATHNQLDAAALLLTCYGRLK